MTLVGFKDWDFHFLQMETQDLQAHFGLISEPSNVSSSAWHPLELDTQIHWKIWG